MIRQAVGAMSLEGFQVLIGLPLVLLGFHLPCDCHSLLVLGIGNCCGNMIALVQPCMDTMSLLIWVKIKGSKTRGDTIQVLHIRLYSHINDGVYFTVRA